MKSETWVLWIKAISVLHIVPWRVQNDRFYHNRSFCSHLSCFDHTGNPSSQLYLITSMHELFCRSPKKRALHPEFLRMQPRENKTFLSFSNFCKLITSKRLISRERYLTCFYWRKQNSKCYALRPSSLLQSSSDMSSFFSLPK